MAKPHARHLLKRHALMPNEAEGREGKRLYDQDVLHDGEVHSDEIPQDKGGESNDRHGGCNRYELTC